MIDLIGQLQSGSRRLLGDFELAGRRVWLHFNGYLDTEGRRNKRHSHSFHEICLVITGSGRFDHGIDEYALRPGDLFLARPGTIHEIIPHQRDSLTVVFVSYELGEPLRMPVSADQLLLERFEREARAVIPNSGGLLALFAALAATPFDGDGQVAAEAMAGALILAIAARAVPPTLAPRLNSKSDDGRLQLAFRFIDANLGLPFSVADVAHQACTSERTLRRLVRRELGRSLLEEISERRLTEAARQLLAHPSHTVAEIGHGTGFRDPAHFNRIFRKRFGLPPGQFRCQGGTVFEPLT